MQAPAELHSAQLAGQGDAVVTANSRAKTVARASLLMALIYNILIPILKLKLCSSLWVRGLLCNQMEAAFFVLHLLLLLLLFYLSRPQSLLDNISLAHEGRLVETNGLIDDLVGLLFARKLFHLHFLLLQLLVVLKKSVNLLQDVLG